LRAGFISFNPSRGIAIIQTGKRSSTPASASAFQSLTRDSNHSNRVFVQPARLRGSFNPSRGIAIIQTSVGRRASVAHLASFNPSRGIAIIQTKQRQLAREQTPRVSIPHAG